MEYFYVYVESIEGDGFQFVPFLTKDQAVKFVLLITKRCKTLRAHLVDL